MNEGLPSEIVNITTSFITSNSMKLSWTIPNNCSSCITYYNIYKSIYLNSNFFIDSSSNTTTTNIIDLSSNTYYYIKVSAVNTNGEGPQSTVIIQSTLPENVGIVTATKGNRLVNLSWNAVSGNTPIIGYLVEKSIDNISWTNDILLNPTTYYTLTNLDNDILYYFRVSARNNVGIGALSCVVTSTPSSIIPSIVYDEPTNVTTISRNMNTPMVRVTSINNGDSDIITFTLVGNPNLINNTAYVFTVTANNKNGSSISSSPSNAIIPVTIPDTITGTSNLINGEPYTFNVTANNINGSSERSISSNSIIPSTIPDAPTTITGISENTQVNVSWVAPINNGGSVITSYTVVSSPGGLTTTTADGSITSATVTGLTNGTSYTFTVFATNINGNSIPSIASSEIIPSTVPDEPTNVLGIPGNTEATIYWDAPLFDGGSVITSYTITSNPGGITKTITSSSSTTNRDLVDGFPYTFFDEVVPITIPNAPTQITCTLGNTFIDLSWNIPNNGGLEILYYHVQYSSINGFNNVYNWIDISSNTNYISISNLINGLPYIFRIATINSIGSSNYSLNTLKHIPFNIVEAPYITNSEIGNNCTSIFFTQSNTSGYPITKYKYTLDNGVSFFEKRGNNTSIFISNINNNTQYNIKISAYTQTGWSNLSNEISITPFDNRIFEIKTDITNLNVDTINDLKNQIPHDENCYLLYDNNIENDRVIVTAKYWVLPKDIIKKCTFRNNLMDNTSFFKYINFNYKYENLTFDMETLLPVKYTNLKDLTNNKLQFINNETGINMTELFEDKFIFQNQYSKIKLKKYKINFDRKSRIIELENGYKFKLSFDLNCINHRNEIKILEANFNDSYGALINKDVKNSIKYFIPKN